MGTGTARSAGPVNLLNAERTIKLLKEITAELRLAGQPLRLRSGQAEGGCPHMVLSTTALLNQRAQAKEKGRPLRAALQNYHRITC